MNRHRHPPTRAGLPRDPELAAAVKIARDLTRRQFLQRSGLGLGAALLAPAILAACSTPGSSEFTFSNWVS